MRKPLAIGATLIVALAAPGAATARERAHQFAVGSAKTELTVEIVRNNGVEHASFSAQSLSKSPNCAAKGQIVYKGPTAEFTAKIDELVITSRLDPMSGSGNAAYFRGVVTKATRGLFLVGSPVAFDTFDSGLPGGRLDQFMLSGQPVMPCMMPLAGHLITRGNVVIKST